MVLALVGVNAGGCAQEDVEVRRQIAGQGPDFGARALADAVAIAAAAPGSATAYARFAARVEELRPGFHEAVLPQAELRLAFLAFAPLVAHESLPSSARITALATTVWPTFFGTPTAPDETPHEYLTRVCREDASLRCKRVVPEERDTVLRALVWRRVVERAQAAYAACTQCKSDSGYAAVLAKMKARHVASGAAAERRKARTRPDDWPTAVMHARAPPGPPVFALRGSGTVELDGAQVRGRPWVEVMREARIKGATLSVHLRPGDRVARLRAVLRDARSAGFKEVALLARQDAYPYELSAYYISLDRRRGAQVRARDVDTIQVLVQALDKASANEPEPVLRL